MLLTIPLNILQIKLNKKNMLLESSFDTICHETLLVKLDSYGIRGNFLKLIKTYLLNRKKLTKFNNVKSDSQNIMFGVPQGSILGPLIFLLYMNDIVNSALEGESVIFADDTNIFVTGNNEKRNLLFSRQSIKICLNI